MSISRTPYRPPLPDAAAALNTILDQLIARYGDDIRQLLSSGSPATTAIKLLQEMEDINNDRAWCVIFRMKSKGLL